MSGSSKTSSSTKELSRKFSSAILKAAEGIVERYQVILSNEEGHWYGRGLELPLVFGDGATPDACIKNTRDAMIGVVAHEIELGERPPTPATEGVRSMQINVRVTAEEKAILDAAARRQGYSGLSDFLRTAALKSTT